MGRAHLQVWAHGAVGQLAAPWAGWEPGTWLSPCLAPAPWHPEPPLLCPSPQGSAMWTTRTKLATQLSCWQRWRPSSRRMT